MSKNPFHLGVVLIVCLMIELGLQVSAEAKVLDKDTEIVVAGSVVMPKFVKVKGGTDVTVNEKGEFIEGIIAESTWFYFPNSTGDTWMPLTGGKKYGAYFKEGTRVVLNSKGDILRGILDTGYEIGLKDRMQSFGPGKFVNTLDYDVKKTDIITVPIPLSERNDSAVPVKAQTEISFHENGAIRTCTVTIDITKKSGKTNENPPILLRPEGWNKLVANGKAGFVKFKNDTQVEFNSQAQVIKGTIDEDIKVVAADGTEKVFKGGTMVDFSSI